MRVAGKGTFFGDAPVSAGTSTLDFDADLTVRAWTAFATCTKILSCFPSCGITASSTTNESPESVPSTSLAVPSGWGLTDWASTEMLIADKGVLAGMLGSGANVAVR